MPKSFTLALRLTTLFSKFGLVFFLAKFLLPEDVGSYGLLAGTVAFVVYLLGMDLYSYTNREILTQAEDNWTQMVYNHSRFLGVVYSLVLPSCLFLFSFDLLPWNSLFWFYLIVVTEHIGIELDRMLISMRLQDKAALVIFTRQGLLALTIIPIYLLFPQARALETVYILWFFFNCVAIAGGVFWIRRRLPTGSQKSFDLRWILTGLRTSLLFLTGTLLLRLLFTVDRQIVGYFEDPEVLGAYVLAITMASGLSSVIAVAVHQFLYPKLVIAAAERDGRGFSCALRSMLFQTVGVSILALTAIMLAGPRIVSWLGADVYRDYYWLVPTATLVISFYNLSLVPHFGLYALRADREIVLVTVFACAVFVASIVIILLVDDSAVLQAVLVALSLASFALLTLKGILLRKLRAAVAN